MPSAVFKTFGARLCFGLLEPVSSSATCLMPDPLGKERRRVTLAAPLLRERPAAEFVGLTPGLDPLREHELEDLTRPFLWSQPAWSA